MNRNAVFCTAVLLVTFAANAFAGDGKETSISETISLYGGNTPALDYFVGVKDIVGARYQLHMPLGQGHHWTASPGVGYGFGSWKDEQPDASPRPITY